MVIDTLFKSHSQPTILVEPGNRSFHHPAVNAQTAAVLRSSLSENRLDSQRSKDPAVRLRIISPVSLKLLRTSSGTTDLSRYPSYGLNQRNQLRHVVAVGAGDRDGQRDTLGIREEVVFGAHFPSIRRIRTRLRPPKTARTDELSTMAREKSIRSAFRKWLSSTRWSFCQTPSRCQSRNRRQQLTPDQQPISRGRYSHGIPVLSTYRIPVRHCRCVSGFRPGWRNRLGLGGGKTGSINFHNSSSNNVFMGTPPLNSRSTPNYKAHF